MKRKHETSKLIIGYILLMTTIVTGITLYIVIKTYDTTPLAYLIPAIFAELATGTGFYYKKAETENKIKIAKAIDEAEKEINKKINLKEIELTDEITDDIGPL